MLLPQAMLGSVSFCSIFLSLQLIGFSVLSPLCQCSWLEQGVVASTLHTGELYGASLIPCQPRALPLMGMTFECRSALPETLQNTLSTNCSALVSFVQPLLWRLGSVFRAEPGSRGLARAHQWRLAGFIQGLNHSLLLSTAGILLMNILPCALSSPQLPRVRDCLERWNCWQMLTINVTAEPNCF